MHGLNHAFGVEGVPGDLDLDFNFLIDQFECILDCFDNNFDKFLIFIGEDLEKISNEAIYSL